MWSKLTLLGKSNYSLYLVYIGKFEGGFVDPMSASSP